MEVPKEDSKLRMTTKEDGFRQLSLVTSSGTAVPAVAITDI